MIYYDVDRIPQKEYERAVGIVKQKSDTKERIVKLLARTGYGLFGVMEMIGGVLFYIPGTVLVLDDGTVVGVLDDGFAGALYAGGAYLWVDGYHKAMKAISGCGF